MAMEFGENGLMKQFSVSRENLRTDKLDLTALTS